MHKVVFAFLFVIAGCAGHRVLEKPIKDLTPSDFWKDQGQRRGLLSGFSGKLKLGYRGKDQEVSGKGRIVGKYPNAFRVELRDPIGRLHYVLVENGNRVWVHFPRNRNGYREEASGKAYFRRALGIPVPFADLAGLFVGEVPARWQNAKHVGWQWDTSVGAFRLELESGGERLKLWVDSEHSSIMRLEWNGSGGKIHAVFSDLDTCCVGVPPSRVFRLAHEVSVTIPDEDTAVELTWDSLVRPTQEIPGGVFEFQAPASDRFVELREP